MRVCHGNVTETGVVDSDSRVIEIAGGGDDRGVIGYRSGHEGEHLGTEECR